MGRTRLLTTGAACAKSCSTRAHICLSNIPGPRFAAKSFASRLAPTFGMYSPVGASLLAKRPDLTPKILCTDWKKYHDQEPLL
ncbi:hypothetical protein DM828_14635 [Pseudomonas umsongensis]|nr:hypothetical protein [Pseudomonas umsongensis]